MAVNHVNIATDMYRHAISTAHSLQMRLSMFLAWIQELTQTFAFALHTANIARFAMKMTWKISVACQSAFSAVLLYLISSLTTWAPEAGEFYRFVEQRHQFVTSSVFLRRTIKPAYSNSIREARLAKHTTSFAVLLYILYHTLALFSHTLNCKYFPVSTLKTSP